MKYYFQFEYQGTINHKKCNICPQGKNKNNRKTLFVCLFVLWALINRFLDSLWTSKHEIPGDRHNNEYGNAGVCTNISWFHKSRYGLFQGRGESHGKLIQKSSFFRGVQTVFELTKTWNPYRTYRFSKILINHRDQEKISPFGNLINIECPRNLCS